MTLAEFLHDYYAPLKGITERTTELYGYTIASLSETLGRPAMLADLSDELAIARFLAHRVRTREPATAAKDRSQLRALHEFAARRRLLDTWPTYPMIRVPERVPECWMIDEFQRLLDSAAQEQVTIDGVPAAKWWRAILLCCYDTGERIGSVMSLRWGEVRGCNVIFRAEGRKGRRRDIFREISVQTADSMLEIKGSRGPEDLVFPWDRGESYVWRRLEIILKRAGLPHGRKDKFHRIRKTTESFAAAAGLDAQKLLDHADPATTRKYLDPRIVRQQSPVGLLPKVS
jgi:integrase